ncbi:hypothetical protein QAD02_006975 [Eretmocerus hayati]|uniref:Uncharacterized protein n=1 Tax=Eretmocerus hayati TaxID=131215 RepID=A0ACC2N3P1_9HYME|nr:hypothetical protein QAD02_006975 [Eretmocerus hayati]
MDINTRLHMMNMLGKFSSQVMQLAHQRLAEAGKDTPGYGLKGLSKEKSSKKSTEMRKKGNDLFKKKKHDESDHRRILHFYNCSIAHATPNSEELALAYSNRSVLWLHTKKFDLYLAARVMDIAIKREGLDAVLKDATDMDQKKVMNLETLLSEDRVDCKKFRSLYNLKSFEKSNGAGPATSESVLDKLLFIVQNNSFRFQTSAPTASVGAFQCECESFESCMSSDCPNRGSILGTCSSLFNHSCDPNTVRMFLPGPKIVLFTTRPVKKGEQLCVCYGPTADCMDKKMRQEDLEARYSFTCECKPCKENWPADPNSLTADPAKRYLLQSHIARTFGGQGEMFHRPPHTWTYNVKNLKGAIKISEFVYQNFDARNAYWLNNSFGLYILGCFHKLYGENVDFPNLCQP